MANQKKSRLPSESVKGKQKGTRTVSSKKNVPMQSSSKKKTNVQNGKKRRTTTSAKKVQNKPLSKYQKRKLRRKKIINAVAISLVLLTAVALVLIFYFRIGEIRVTGSTRYSKEEIIAASELQIGSNIITAKTKNSMESIPKKLPFIEAVKVKKSSPTAVSIEVTEAVPAAVYQTPSGYVLLSSTGKILELDATEYLDEVPVIKGVSFVSYEVGAQADYANGTDFEGEDIKTVLDELFVAIAKYNLDIRVVDWSKSISLKLKYGEVLIIDLGYPENIDEKLYAAKCFIDERFISGEKGTLRVSDPDNMAFSYEPNNPELAGESAQVPQEEPQSGE